MTKPSPAWRAAIASALVLAAACAPDNVDPVGTPPPPPVAPPPPPPAPVASNLWSDSLTWVPGLAPKPGENVLIPAGKTVILDVATPALNQLAVEGTLDVSREHDAAITAREILVKGTFRAGSEESPYRKRLVITFTGADSGAGAAFIGAKVFAIYSGATLELHGEPRAGWTRLAATAMPGTSTLTLAEPMNWRAGDQVVVASTDFDPAQAEAMAVVSATPSSVTLQGALRYRHWGTNQVIAGKTVDERAEVGLLTRNIVIQGDSVISSAGYGGHVIVLRGGTAHVEGVQFLRMGQAGQVARYPFHWHMANDVSGQYLRQSSISRTNNRCVTVHGSDNAVVSNNVCYDHLGHGYFLEDGSESGNTMDHNLGLMSRTPSTALRILPSDANPSTFWITNPANVFTRNAAAGSVGFGFWYALPAAPTGFSTGQADLPRITPLGEFSNNVAHSNRQAGLNVDNGPKADLTTETASYNPRVGGVATGIAAQAVFRNFTGWKHTGRAMWIRGSNLVVDGAILADNLQGLTFANNDDVMQHSLIVGESDNTTTSPNASYPIRGFEFYDGTVGVNDVTFANFVSRPGRPASALGYNRKDGFPVSQLNFATAVTLMNSNAVYLETPAADKDGDKASMFLDTDGSVTGTAGRTVVSNLPFLVTPGCALRSEWNSYVCSGRYDGLVIQSEGTEAAAPVTLVRDDGASVMLVGVPNNPLSAQMTLATGRRYDMSFGVSAPPKVRVTMQRGIEGDWTRVRIPYNVTSFTVKRDGSAINAAASLAEVDAGTGDKYWYDPQNAAVYVKLYVRAGRTNTFVQLAPR